MLISFCNKARKVRVYKYEFIARNDPTSVEAETIFKGLWINYNRLIKTASSTVWAEEKEVLIDWWISGPLTPPMPLDDPSIK